MAKKAGLGRGLGKGLGSGMISLTPTDNTQETEEGKAGKSLKKENTKASVKETAKKTASKKGTTKKETSKAAAKTKKDDIDDLRESEIGANEALDNGTGEVLLKLTLIEPNKSQPRKDFDIEALKELSESIKQFGMLQPIVVRKKGDKYFEIIAGERRWRAAKLAGLKEVPVIIREFTPEQVMEAALIENIQRQDLNPIEEALAFTNLISEYSLTHEEVAQKVSKSRAQITNIMRLLKLNNSVQQMLIAGELSMGHARAILAINDEELQKEIAKTVIDNDLSVRETEKHIKDILEPRPLKQKQPEINPAGMLVYRDMEQKLSNALGSKVGIKTKNGKKGKIEIEYSSQEELERLFDRLS